MILSLQGCMAVGKTTAARYLQAHTQQVQVFFESTGDVIQQVRSRHLDKTHYPDYLEIQKLWLANEVRRWEQAAKYPHSVLDFGAEEIEFYTLHYPQSIGQDWEVERPLQQELAAVRRCMPDRILFLDASDAVLRARKEADSTRSREFFDHYLTHMLPQKRAWFAPKDNVDWLSVDLLTPEQVGRQVQDWCLRCIQQGE